ncbi:MAG: hypothetical protein HY842_13715 [Bacteroidetes bacterium]|nr:hypothetical protein [Bacteroidota bacterium]
MNNLFKNYLGNELDHYLNFAWELDRNEVAQKAVSAAKEIMKNTDVLVIIGYSFPNFNKRIDRNILEDFATNTSRKYKVYYQTHPNEIEALCKNFHWLMEGKVNAEPITDLKQFFIPPEFVFPEKGLQKSMYENTELWKD